MIDIKKGIATLKNTHGYENIGNALLENHDLVYKIISEAERMDRELEILHEFLMELYEYDSIVPKIMDVLDKIDAIQ